MMIIDIKKGISMLCSLKDGYNKVDIKLKYSEIAAIQQDNVASKLMDNESIKDKPNFSLMVNKGLPISFFKILKIRCHIVKIVLRVISAQNR